jgi:hypothetical protein
MVWVVHKQYIYNSCRQLKVNLKVPVFMVVSVRDE